MKTVIPEIAGYTNSVVEAGRDIALATADRDVQLAMSTAIHAVANSIERLVVAFTTFLGDKKNIEFQKGFATATKNVGDAINAMVAAADEGALHKLFTAITLSREAADNLLSSPPSGPEATIASARRLGEALVELSSQISGSAGKCLDPHKGQKILATLDGIKSSHVNFIRGASGASSPHDPAFRQLHSEVLSELEQLITIAKTPLDYSARYTQAYDTALAQLADLANALNQFSRQLIDLLNNPNHSEQDFIDIAAKTARTARAFLNMAEKALADVQDPGRRRMIQALMKDIQDLTTDLVRTAQALRKDPNNPQLKEKLAQINNALEQKLQQMLTLLGPADQDLTTKLNLSSRYLDKLLQELAANIDTLSREQLLDYAEAIQQLTVTTARDAKAVADASSDPQEREAIARTIPGLVSTCQTLVGTTRALADNRQDAALRKKFAQDKDDFSEALHQVRVAAHLELPRIKNVPPPPVPRDTDSELVQAAIQQSAAALALAARAREFAESVGDPAKKAHINAAATRLEELANLIVESARLAASNPNDPRLQQDLDATQKLLAEAIRNIIELTAGKGSSLAQLLRDMELSAGANEDDALLFSTVEELLREIDAFSAALKAGSLSAQELVARARALAQRAADLAKMLVQLASRSEDPSRKPVYTQLANILRDKGVQIKMLAAVQVAGGEDTGQVSSTVQGLRNEVSEAGRMLRVDALRRRVHRTNKQTELLRKLLGAWNAAHNLIQ